MFSFDLFALGSLFAFVSFRSFGFFWFDLLLLFALAFIGFVVDLVLARSAAPDAYLVVIVGELKAEDHKKCDLELLKQLTRLRRHVPETLCVKCLKLTP